MMLFDVVFNAEFAYSILRVTTPLLFATAAALISSRAGVINIAIEGMMLIAALCGVIFSSSSGNVWFGLVMAVFSGACTGFVLAYFSMNLKTDIILAAISINLIASGGTVFILYLVAGDKGISSSLASGVIPKLHIPWLVNLPVPGRILSGHNVLTYVAFALMPLLSFFLYRMPLGLRIRSVGENEHAADSVGISVKRIRYTALILSGVFAGLGGAYMSMGYVSWFSRDMTAGRGYIALAANAMGGSRPMGGLLTSLLFGLFDSLSNTLQLLKIPFEFVSMLPYLATVIGLVLYSMGRSGREQKLKTAMKKTSGIQNIQGRGG